MSKVVDARGLLCPEPVLRVKNVLEQMTGGNLEVRVDNAAAKENVTRFCENKGWTVVVEKAGADFVLKVSK